MTALDSPTQGRTSRAARQDAERAAGSLVRAVGRASRAALALCVLGLALGAAGLVLDAVELLVGLPVAVLAGYVRLALVDAQRAGPAPASGAPLPVLFERDVHEHLARLADEIGVRCPTQVWVVIEPEVRLEPDPEHPVLYIGSPLLWHLDVAELDRLLARPLSAMRAVLDPQVRPGLLLAARLESVRLTSDSTPMIGALVRRLGRRLELRQQSLLEAVHDWSDGCVPRRLRPTVADETELVALREVDEVEAVRRRAAAGAGIVAAGPTAGAMATLAACELAGVLEPREHRLVLQPASALLVDQLTTDRRLAERLAARIGGGTPLTPRAELPARVCMGRWRRERDRGLPVVVRLTGRWPGTLAELFEVLDRGASRSDVDAEPVDRVPALGALLARHPERLQAGAGSDPDEAGEGRRSDAVVALLAAAVRVAAVEQGRASLGWDDLWGAQLLDLDGEPVPVVAFVGDAVARRDTGSLLSWLHQLGVVVDVPWSRAEPPAGDPDQPPITVLPVRFGSATPGRRSGGQRADIVLLDGWLLGYPYPGRRPVRDLLGRLGGRRSNRSLSDLARTNRERLVGLAAPTSSVRLVDVTSAQLDGGPDGTGWRLWIETADRRLELCGRGRAGVLAEALRRDLGGRLARSGTALPDLAGTCWRARVCRLLATVVAAASLVGAVGMLVGPKPATYLPGADAGGWTLAVLLLGLVLVLLCRVAQGEADRSVRRRGDPRNPAL